MCVYLETFLLLTVFSGAPHGTETDKADRLGTLLPDGRSVPFYIFGGKHMKKIAIIMGSDSDLPVVRKAADTLQSFGVPYEMHVYSAHRTPVEARDFAVNARSAGFGAIIAAAGMAAHLAGAIAANTTLPVIGIPMKSTTFSNGIDALLSTVQMPSGIPVATVAVDGAVNAALLSIEILAVTDEELAAKLEAKRKADAEKVLAKDAALQ
jgi:5-(carboxyamino)imidazole ribonucleotide mutase